MEKRKLDFPRNDLSRRGSTRGVRRQSLDSAMFHHCRRLVEDSMTMTVLLNRFANFACRAADQDEYQRLRRSAGAHYAPSAWSQKVSLDSCDAKFKLPVVASTDKKPGSEPLIRYEAFGGINWARHGRSFKRPRACRSVKKRSCGADWLGAVHRLDTAISSGGDRPGFTRNCPMKSRSWACSSRGAVSEPSPLIYLRGFLVVSEENPGASAGGGFGRMLQFCHSRVIHVTRNALSFGG